MALAHKRAFLVVVGGTALIAAVWFLWPAPQPVYKGTPLSGWLAILDSPATMLNERKQAEESIRAIGTNAVAYLAAELNVRDSITEKLITPLLMKQTLIKFDRITPAMRRRRALVGYFVLSDLVTPSDRIEESKQFSDNWAELMQLKSRYRLSWPGVVACIQQTSEIPPMRPPKRKMTR